MDTLINIAAGAFLPTVLGLIIALLSGHQAREDAEIFEMTARGAEDRCRGLVSAQKAALSDLNRTRQELAETGRLMREWRAEARRLEASNKALKGWTKRYRWQLAEADH